MAKKQPEVTEQTKEYIMEAFWAIYCKKRIDKITVGEIVALAGYNRSTFYEYFHDVYDVLEQIEDRLIPDLEHLPPSDTAGNSPLQMEAFMKMYEQNSKYYPVLLGDKGDPAFQGRIKQCLKSRLMEAFQANDLFDAETVDYTLEFMLSAMIGVLSYWYGQTKPMNHERLLQLMTQLCQNDVMRGLVSLITSSDKPNGIVG